MSGPCAHIFRNNCKHRWWIHTSLLAKGNKKSKVSCVIWEELKEYLKKFEKFIFDSNDYLYKYDIIPLDDSQFLNLNHYDYKNPSYDWHMDGTLNNQNYDLKLTCLLNVSTEDYSGGNLKFDLGPHAGKKRYHVCKEIRPQGSIIIFPSFTYHCVTPVTKGTRYSLVNWCLGRPWY